MASDCDYGILAGDRNGILEYRFRLDRRRRAGELKLLRQPN